MATVGVEFAQSLVTALMAASLVLLAGLALVRAAVRTWSQSAGDGRRGGRAVVLEPALVVAGEMASPVRPSAGVAKAGAPTRAPPTTFGAVRRQQLRDSLDQLRRLAE